jgi:hypothetical protein
MRKLYTLILLMVLSQANMKAQSLAYTYWLGTKPPSLNLGASFGPDTISFGAFGGALTATSTYYTIGSQFFIHDFYPSTACQDTGKYTFVNNGSSLVFTLISDPCTSRRNTLINYSWTFWAWTGVSDLSSTTSAIIYPNPSENGIYNLVIPGKSTGTHQVTLFDLSGRMVYSAALESAENILDLEFLAPGIYNGSCTSERGVVPFKIVR